MAFFVADFTFFGPRLARCAMHSEPDLNRLHAALLLSGLLHAMLLLALPWLLDGPAPTLASNVAENTLIARLGPLRSEDVPEPGPRRDDTKQAPAGPPTADKEPFFPESKLTRLPKPIGDMGLDIPEARQLSSSGSMAIRLWIDRMGKVVSMEIDQTDLPVEFASAVAAAFGKMRFEPGEINGRPVGSILRFEITHNSAALLPR
jgi:hypothetical protein